MAARSKLTVEILTKLGAKRLAEILIEDAGRNRQLKQAVQMALAAETGSSELAHQIRKRLATLASTIIAGQGDERTPRTATGSG